MFCRFVYSNSSVCAGGETARSSNGCEHLSAFPTIPSAQPSEGPECGWIDAKDALCCHSARTHRYLFSVFLSPSRYVHRISRVAISIKVVSFVYALLRALNSCLDATTYIHRVVALFFQRTSRLCGLVQELPYHPMVSSLSRRVSIL